MSKLRRTIWSAWAWACFGLACGVLLPVVAVVRVVTTPFDRGHYRAGYLFRQSAVFMQKMNPLWHFKVRGVMPANPRNPYVVVSNHESFVDIILISHLPFEMKWLSKAQLFKIPVAGWLMHLAGDIQVERGDRASGAKALAQCRDRLDKKVSVMIFPEGTRSATGEMLPFKDGAFRLAIEAGVPILPLAVEGTPSALRKHDWRLGESTAIVQVLEPVTTEGLTIDDIDKLKFDVRERIAVALADLRAELGTADE
jgi:1-acyl-sn-glycerol-3-phosphate acyltransferase